MPPSNDNLPGTRPPLANPRASREAQAAARAAAQNDAFLREVDDALREDQLLGFLRRWGKPLAAALVLGLAALGGGLWWQNHRAHQQEADAEAITLAQMPAIQARLLPPGNGFGLGDCGRISAELSMASSRQAPKRRCRTMLERTSVPSTHRFAICSS